MRGPLVPALGPPAAPVATGRVRALDVPSATLAMRANPEGADDRRGAVVRVLAVASHGPAPHERYDGDGVPSGPAAAPIPLGARILAAAELPVELDEARVRDPACRAGEVRPRSDTQLDPCYADAPSALIEEDACT